MVNYSIPITFSDLEDTDRDFEKYYGEKFPVEIQHFNKTIELFISLFSNSKRTYRENKTDYIQLLAVRILQDSRSALILASKGLYPQSIGLTRSVLESISLIYDFKINPTHEDIWFNGSMNQRDKLFKAATVRKRVDAAKITNVANIKGLYSLLSQWSIHTNRDSLIWYMEIHDHILKYHWAGYSQSPIATIIVFLSPIFALSQGLFVLTEEDLYTFIGSGWVDDYMKWKSEHLIIAKKIANLLGRDTFDNKVMKSPKIKYSE
jgi:hypothetical protein